MIAELNHILDILRQLTSQKSLWNICFKSSLKVYQLNCKMTVKTFSDCVFTKLNERPYTHTKVTEQHYAEYSVTDIVEWNINDIIQLLLQTNLG